MKKIKGFTLVELIGVITVLGVIVLITMPVITGTVKKSKEQAYNKQVDTIVRVAKEWGTENVDSLPEVVPGMGAITKIIQLDTLVSAGKIQNSTIIDPRSNETISGCVLVSYNLDYNQYEYKYNSNEEYCTILYGDVNSDGSINGRDLGLLMQYLSDWDVEINLSAADVNVDGDINNGDYVLLHQYLSDWDVELGN